MFMRLQTQWVIAGMGSVIGLNYQSFEVLCRIYKVENTKDLFEEIHEIELGALETIRREERERAEKNGA